MVGPNFRVGKKIVCGNFRELGSDRIFKQVNTSLSNWSPLSAGAAAGSGTPPLPVAGSQRVSLRSLWPEREVQGHGAGVARPSLEDLLHQYDHTFLLKTVLMIAIQLIICMEYVHTKSLQPQHEARGLPGGAARQQA